MSQPTMSATAIGESTGSSDGNHHLLDRALGEHVDRARVIRLRGAFHDSLDLAELAAHFLDHESRAAPDGFHRHRAEEIGNEPADEEPDDDLPDSTGRTVMWRPASSSLCV
jgi:hypothetical protein